MTRVLYLAFESALGGAELQLVATIESLDRARFSPLVLLRDEGPLAARLRAAGADVICDPRLTYLLRGARRPSTALHNASGFFRGTMAIRRVIRARAVDLIHGFVEPSIKYAAAAAIVTGVPAICTLHDVLGPPYGRLHQRAIAWCLRLGCDITITPSEANRVLLLNAGVPAASVRTIYNGGGDPEMRPANAPDTPGTPIALDRHSARQQLALPADAFVVGLVGRFAATKGHDVLVRAMPALLAQAPHAHVLFVGEALFDGEAACLASVRHAVQAAGLDDRVRFAGFLADVAPAYAAMDVLAHPATAHDTLPGAIIEAMASGRPVVASAVGGVPEMIEPGVTGFLVPPGDVGALADALGAIARHPARAAMGEAGRARAARQFSRDRYQRELAAVYADVLRRGRGTLSAAAIANGLARGAAVVLAAGQAAFLTRHVTLAEYGIVTAMGFLAILGLFVAAIGARMGNELAGTRARQGQAGEQANRRLFVATVSLLLIASVGVIATLALASPWIPWSRLVNTADVTLAVQARNSLALAGVIQLVAAPLAVVTFAFRAYDEAGDIAWQTFAIAILSFAIAMAGVRAGPSLPVIAAAPMLATLIVSTIAVAVFLTRRRWSPGDAGRPARAWRIARPLARGALAFAVLGTLFGWLTTTSTYAVSLTQGFEAAARVDLYGKLLLAALIVQGEMLHPLWPIYARLHAAGDVEGTRRLVHQSLRLGWGLIAATAVIVALFGRPLLHVLTGRDIPFDAPSLIALIVYGLAFGTLQPVLTCFNATNRLREGLMATAAGVMLATVGTIAGGRMAGTPGALVGLASGLALAAGLLLARLARPLPLEKGVLVP